MKATTQFTAPATVGACVTVIVSAIGNAGWLPKELSTPEVTAAVSGLLTTGATALTSYINAILRDRKRERMERDQKCTS